MARNTQLILAEETGVTKVVDPLGGSYYVEALTHSVAHHAWELIREVEDLGGMTKAVESGMPKMRIEEAAALKQARIDKGEEVVVGVNKYQVAEDSVVNVREIDNDAVRTQQLAKLAQVRDNRDEAATQAALHRRRKGLRGIRICSPSRSTRCGRGPQWVRYPMPWNQSSALQGRCAFDLRRLRQGLRGRRRLPGYRAAHRGLCRARGPPAAHAGGQVGAGWPTTAAPR